MKIQLISKDPELCRLCREALAALPVRCGLSVVGPEDVEPGVDLCILDLEACDSIPAVLEQSRSRRLFLIDRKDLASLEYHVAAEDSILLKPVTAGMLAAFMTVVTAGILPADSEELAVMVSGPPSAWNMPIAVVGAAALTLREAPRCSKTLISSNARMREIQTLITQIGWSDAPVLIQGETGSGKEVVARDLHAHSPRGERPFLKLNCAALPFELVESELFGYERGAFTGAFQKKIGMFELADGGTILLDEIGDMDTRLQAKLLQVLQDQEFHRIGGNEVVKVDVRVMAATHRDLEKAILDQTFREDLYYRLNVITLHLPPLRERREDILPLAEFLLKKYAAKGSPIPAIPVDLQDAMMTYHWPGNVRELENYARKLVIMRDPDSLTCELRARSRRKPVLVTPTAMLIETAPPAEPAAGSSSLEEATIVKQRAEVDAILAALNCTRWNRKKAAALLKIHYRALLYKMKKLGLENKPATFGAGAEATVRKTAAAF